MKKIAYLLLTISFCGLTACKTGTKKGGNMDNETLVKIETTFRPNLFIRSIFTKKALCLLPVRETM